ncbi:MAG: NUDIX hydrolase [Candidatus Altiarchaeales archaeon]|nr:MAG: NUDIX hydrolase [Candidatus Altiarchaeales archaeon]
MEERSPRLTVDAIILIKDSIVLIRRRNPPFRGMWALPGGFVEYGETVEHAVRREAKEETGLDVEIERLVGVYSDPDRDPRGHTVSICFLCRPVGGSLKANTDSVDVKEFELSKIPGLAFDHEKILRDLRL